MSQHVVEKDKETKFVFGWDQPLQSFFLQKHDLTLPEDEQIVVWLGATAETQMYDVQDLVREGRKHGLYIPHTEQVKLYGERDDGR